MKLGGRFISRYVAAFMFLHHNICSIADFYSTFQKYPKHAKYKKKGLANLEELDAMFDKAHVTGATSCIPGEISDSTDDEGVVEVPESEEDEDVSPKANKDGKAAKDGKLKDEKADGKKKV